MLADAEDRDDVGMVQPSRGTGLALESPALLGVAEHVAGQQLERDVAAERNLLGLVHDPHAPMADLAQDVEVAELPRRWRLSRSERGRRCVPRVVASSTTAIFSSIASAGKTSRISSA